MPCARRTLAPAATAILQSEKFPDSVLEMHNQIAFVQFAEIDLRAVALGTTQMPACMDRESSK